MPVKRLSLVVKGRVQGVCFRAFTEGVAKRLNLTGWVRNLPDGSVETLAEGEEKDLRDFWAQIKTGPPASRVVEVAESWGESTGEFHDFDIVYFGARYF